MAGASTAIAGESAEADSSGYEEVVGNLVSQGGGVVEQGVQVEQEASEQSYQGYPQNPSGRDWPSQQGG